MGNPPEMLALVNMALCLVIVHVCLCRLNQMSAGVLLRTRSQYAVFLNCALASALQPLWGERPGWGAIAMACALLFDLAVTSRKWMNGPPQDQFLPMEVRRD